LHVTHDVESGGAARAALRVVQAQRRAGMDSTVLVNEAAHKRDYVLTPKPTGLRYVRRFFSRTVDLAIASLQKNDNPNLHSAGFQSAISVREINNSSADIVNLHWVNGGMLSLFAISRIRKPVVWTLHDMWAFSGAEHYDNGNERWRKKYVSKSRSLALQGLDLDRFVWILKRLLWKKKFSIVTSSKWLRKCVETSDLMKDWPTQAIHTPIDLEMWKPEDKRTARTLLRIPIDHDVLLFGAVGGTRDPRKGFDLLLEALQKLSKNGNRFSVVIFGEETRELTLSLGSSAVFLGVVHDDLTLRLAYSAADVFLLPSRQDNLPNTGIESIACGTPVVSFDVGGIGDIVEHKVSGYLAKKFDTSDFARGVEWALLQSKEGQLSKSSRQWAESQFSFSGIGDAYKSLYSSILSDNQES
jgi:glycosyltransferase involved in cell wall biosynthesis